MTPSQNRNAGFSLVELLVCIAIIAILMALYLPTLSKAFNKAKSVSTQEGFRQSYIGEMAEGANEARAKLGPPPGRDEARAAFRMNLETGEGDQIVTKLVYVVKSDAEFKAYYHTLIDPDNSVELEFQAGYLVAEDGEGNAFYLTPIIDLHRVPARLGVFPVGWTYLSTQLTDTSTGNIGCDVIYNDSRTVYLKYPGQFPASRVVAELSHDYVVKTGSED